MKNYHIEIALITSGHDPLDDRIFYKEALALKQAGYKVIIIAPCDKSFIREGIKVECIPKFENRFMRFSLTNILLILKTFKLKPAIVHFQDADTLPFAPVLKMLKRIKIIYDVHEDYTAQILQKGWIKPAFLRIIVSKMWGKIEKHVSAYMDAIIVAEPGIYKRFTKYKVTNLILLRNFVILNLMKPKISEYSSDSKETILVYVGLLDINKGVDVIIKSLEYLDNANIKLWLYGAWGNENFKKYCQSLKGYRKVEYKGQTNMEEIYKILPEADIGLAVFKRTVKHQKSLPIKLFEYMGAGLAIVISDFDYWRKLFSKCALFVNPDNPKDVAEKIKALIGDPYLKKKLALNGKKLVEEKYNWEKESKKLIKLYSKLLNKK